MQKETGSVGKKSDVRKDQRLAWGGGRERGWGGNLLDWFQKKKGGGGELAQKSNTEGKGGRNRSATLKRRGQPSGKGGEMHSQKKKKRKIIFPLNKKGGGGEGKGKGGRDSVKRGGARGGSFRKVGKRNPFTGREGTKSESTDVLGPRTLESRPTPK